MMRFDDGTADVQTHPQTFGLRAEEGFEKTFGIRQPMSPVSDGDFDLVAVLEDVDQQVLVDGVIHRLQAVLDEVEQHLFDQNRVGQHIGKVGRDTAHDRYLAPACMNLGQTDGVIDHGADLDALATGFTAFDEFTDAANDLASALRLARGFFEGGQQGGRIRAAGLDHRHRAHTVICDRRERLVQLPRGCVAR